MVVGGWNRCLGVCVLAATMQQGLVLGCENCCMLPQFESVFSVWVLMQGKKKVFILPSTCYCHCWASKSLFPVLFPKITFCHPMQPPWGEAPSPSCPRGDAATAAMVWELARSSSVLAHGQVPAMGAVVLPVPSTGCQPCLGKNTDSIRAWPRSISSMLWVGLVTPEHGVCRVHR